MSVGIIVVCAGVVILFFLVRWHAKATVYSCPNCGHSFQVTALRDFLSPHLPFKKYLKCPNCSKRSWCPASEKKPS